MIESPSVLPEAEVDYATPAPSRPRLPLVFTAVTISSGTQQPSSGRAVMKLTNEHECTNHVVRLPGTDASRRAAHADLDFHLSGPTYGEFFNAFDLTLEMKINGQDYSRAKSIQVRQQIREAMIRMAPVENGQQVMVDLILKGTLKGKGNSSANASPAGSPVGAKSKFDGSGAWRQLSQEGTIMQQCKIFMSRG